MGVKFPVRVWDSREMTPYTPYIGRERDARMHTTIYSGEADGLSQGRHKRSMYGRAIMRARVSTCATTEQQSPCTCVCHTERTFSWVVIVRAAAVEIVVQVCQIARKNTLDSTTTCRVERPSS